MYYVSICSILTRKKIIKHSLHLLLPLIFATCCSPYKTPKVISQHTWTPSSTVLLFNLGNILMEAITMFIGDGSHVFRKKSTRECRKWSFSSSVWWNLFLHNFTKFLAFSLPRKFLKMFSNAFQALPSVEFNSVLKYWSSNSCVTCGPTKISSFILVSLILGNFCLEQANPLLYFSTAFTDISVKSSLICNRDKLIFDLSPKAGSATFFWPGVVCEWSGHFFIL